MDHRTVERVSDTTIYLVAQAEAEFIEVMTLLIELHAEGGYAPLDLDKASKDVYAVMGEGRTWLAKDGEGEPIGVLGLIEVPFWYSDLTFLISKWFYVRPEFRFGQVGMKLLLEARAEADRIGKIAFVQTTNPRRKPKKGTWLSVAGEAVGCFPAGYMLRLGGATHGQRARDHADDPGHEQAAGSAT